VRSGSRRSAGIRARPAAADQNTIGTDAACT
jgi:hypothetical protein